MRDSRRPQSQLYTSILCNNLVVKQVIADSNGAIIPLHGKIPALKSWKHYQQHSPTTGELKNWFTENITAYGVLLGKVSGLVVLDFDTPGGLDTFARQFPEYINTQIVKTRRGHHLYYRVKFPVYTQMFGEGELRGEGTYVVGPASRITSDQGPVEYKLIWQTEIKELTQSDIRRIQTYYGSSTKTPQQPAQIQPRKKVSRTTIRQAYLDKAQHGRNNALYNIARQAKKSGISQEQIETCLIDTHIHKSATQQHHRETDQQRRAEAQRTIASAYRSTTTSTTRAVADQSQKGLLPNNLREKFIEHSGTKQARLIEALYHAGNQAGELLTEKEINTVAQRYKISSKTTSECLRGTLNNIHQKPIFTRTSPPNVGEGDKRKINKDNDVSKRGRQTRNWYVLPSVDYLCACFDVVPQSADPLTKADLMSSKAYRQGMQRELIRRTRPEWAMARYADRLGVSTRTIRRYHNEMGIVATPIIGYVPLNWANVDNPALYAESCSSRLTLTPGQWLQREDGKRYPAIKGIALKQLGEHRLVACKQLPPLLQLSEKPLEASAVIWRRLDLLRDAYDWVGGAIDFPPILPAPEPYQSSQKSSGLALKPQPIQPFEDDKVSLRMAASHKKQAYDDKQDGFGNSNCNANVKNGFVNSQLTLVKGIGQSRADRLANLGITTLRGLIDFGAHRLGKVYWPGGYVTEATAQKWIADAELLLGLRNLSDAERQQKQQKVYRNWMKGYLAYLEDVCAWEESLFGIPLDDFNSPLTDVLYWMRRKIQNQTPLNLQGDQDDIRQLLELTRNFADWYLPRLQMFIHGNDVDRYCLGGRMQWRSFENRLIRLQTKRDALFINVNVNH